METKLQGLLDLERSSCRWIALRGCGGVWNAHWAVWEPSRKDPEPSTVGGQPWRVLGPRVVPDQATWQGNPEILRCGVAAGS